MQRYPTPPAPGQRPHLLVPVEDPVQVRRAAEQRQRGQVGFPVPALRGRIDQVRRVVGRPQHVAGPEIAVDACRRFGRAAVLVDRFQEALDLDHVGGPQRAAVGRHPQVRRQPLIREPGRPGPVVRTGGQRERPDVPGLAGTEPVRPGPVQRGQRRAQPVRGPRRGRSRCDPLQDQQVGKFGEHLRYRCACGGEPPQPGGLRGEEPRRRLARRPALREDRGAVVEGEPGRRADAPAAHRRLADPLMGQKRGDKMRV